MKVLSLFDGMSCGRIALDRAGIKVDQYFASEVDKYAIQVTKANWPDTVHLGDVRNVLGTNLPNIDLLIGGSPCQSFSFAGKRNGMTTKSNEKILTLEQYLDLKEQGFDFEGQSYLFWEYVRILKEVKPKCFLLENVLMKKEWEQVITKTLGVDPIMINSALVSAQNRKRLYWTNIPDITQPKDRGILLKDIIEDLVPNMNYYVDQDKSFCIDANYAKGGNLDQYFNKSRRQLVFGGAFRGRYNKDGTTSQKLEINGTYKANAITTVQKDSLCVQVGTADINGHDCLKRVYSVEGKSPTLTAVQGGNQEAKIAIDTIRIAQIQGRRINEHGVRDDYNKGLPYTQCLQVKHENDKASCLTTVNKDNVLTTLEPGRYDDCYKNLQEGLHWRKLTPVECERLQTVPENYTAYVSNSQRYRMLGNGWTVDVIAHIFSFIDKPAVSYDIAVGDNLKLFA